ncbi:MAG TPA: type II toxin-antitoxin system VapC family toxin [Thermoanaerobaculia bacterium]|nr:type II toxin-antitoxin system VapC family toxin [Thermoanaerobaculia bacterium]
MNLLLDTHVWLWSLLDPERLRPEAVAALQDPDNRLYLSPVSVWEALLLVERRRVELQGDPRAWVVKVLEEVPMFEAPLTFEVAIGSRAVPLPHVDPADRFLAATANAHDLVLLTADRRLLDCAELRTLAA